MNESPIFIHSLFRAGSTYLFNVFRRSAAGYWCYQEALHELVAFACNEPEHLLSNLGDEAMRIYRHPQMDTPYFQELYETWPSWRDAFSESAVFDGYFAPPNTDIGIPYWKALTEAAQGRPVFQECRTSGRIKEIKQQLGGYHVYLWRNPWDQWWSYKVTPYFDVANQLIINAPNSPPAVGMLLAAVGFDHYSSDDIADAIAHFSARPLTSENSYLVFYLLWCLGLREGKTHAQLMLNIDRLSDSPAYRNEMQAQFAEGGGGGIDFSDCHVPQCIYIEQDKLFFRPLEDKVHAWLLEGGWSQEDLNQLQALRQQFQPVSWGEPIGTANSLDLVEQAARARTLARCFETNIAEAELRAIAAEARATVAEAALEVSRKELHEVHLANDHHWQQAQALLNSTSWRVTAPLRWISSVAHVSPRRVLKPCLKLFLQHAMLYIRRAPRLKNAVLCILDKFPGLKLRLFQVATGLQLSPGQRQNFLTDNDHITPRAREIYADLKTAIEQRQKGKS